MHYDVEKNKLIKILCVLALTIFFYAIFTYCSISYGKDPYIYTKNSNDLPTDFDTQYPGYRVLLETIVTNNPNWTIKLLDTELDFNTVLDNECGHGKNLVHKNWCTSDWICPECGTKTYDTGYWYCASRNAIEYIIDPRNFMNDNNMFQFLQLSNDTNITKEQVAIMASRISYLNNQPIIDAIYEAAIESNVNPFYIIGKILQEQGSGASALCSGNGFNGQYIGYYNLFNVGASGNTEEQVIANGLSYAAGKGWDTPKKAILGGITTVKNYINRGQNTTYFQKYNVVYSPYYSWQYAQNVLDARSVGLNLMTYYKNANLLDSNFTFIIPLYRNMANVKGDFVTVNVDTSINLRGSPNGEVLLTIDGGTIVLRTESATEKIDGYYWDKVITLKGSGYMARDNADSSRIYLVPIELATLNPLIPIVIEPAENYSGPDNNNYIKAEPDVTVEQLKTTYPTATIVDKDGNEINGNTLVGTGAKITITRIIESNNSISNQTENNTVTENVVGNIVTNNTENVVGNTVTNSTENVVSNTAENIENNTIVENTSTNNIQQTETITYTVVKLGDVNGDGKIKATDYMKIKNYIMEVSQLSECEVLAADVNKDGKVKATDYMKIKNYIMSVSTINI